MDSGQTGPSAATTLSPPSALISTSRQARFNAPPVCGKLAKWCIRSHRAALIRKDMAPHFHSESRARLVGERSLAFRASLALSQAQRRSGAQKADGGRRLVVKKKGDGRREKGKREGWWRSRAWPCGRWRRPRFITRVLLLSFAPPRLSDLRSFACDHCLPYVKATYICLESRPSYH